MAFYFAPREARTTLTCPECGAPLDESLVCPRCGRAYREAPHGLECKEG